MSMNTASQSWAFLSTPSARRATTPIRTACTCGRISIHALREEGDSCLCRLVWRLEISIHALREEGDGGIGPHPGEIEVISIHALREEGDSSARARLTGALDFYPRPPRGGRFLRISVDIRPSTFLSTPSARRATVAPDPDNFSAGQFLSTPSARRATQLPIGRDDASKISIHALREEGDTKILPTYAKAAHFYPRPPRGGRQTETGKKKAVNDFYPRPPRGGRPFVIRLPELS